MKSLSADDDVYEAVSDALSALASDLEPAESHGVLCGMLCGPQTFEVDAWLAHLVGYADEPVGSLTRDHPLLRLVEHTQANLGDGEFGLQLLLPADGEALGYRAEALGLWCRGFLSGFGMHGAVPGLTDEAREFLQDLARISQLDPEQPANEAGERDFQEIVEYARMGAQMLYDERPAPVAPNVRSLH